MLKYSKWCERRQNSIFQHISCNDTKQLMLRLGCHRLSCIDGNRTIQEGKETADVLDWQTLNNQREIFESLPSVVSLLRVQPTMCLLSRLRPVHLEIPFFFFPFLFLERNWLLHEFIKPVRIWLVCLWWLGVKLRGAAESSTLDSSLKGAENMMIRWHDIFKVTLLLTV